MTLFSIRMTDFPFVKVEIVRGIIYFCGKPRRIAVYQSELFQPVLGNVCCSYLYQNISFFLLCPYFRFTILFLYLFPVTHSSPLLHFHPTGFYDCFETRVSLYFSSLLCLSSYCTCNLRASVSTFLYILLCSFSSVSSFFKIPLCFL